LYLYKDGQEFNSYSFQKFENDLWPIVGKSDQEYVHQNSCIYGKNIHMTSAAVDIIWKSSKNFAIGLNVGYSISLGMFTNQPEDYSYTFGTFTEIHNVNNQLILPSKTTFLNKSRLSAGLSI